MKRQSGAPVTYDVVLDGRLVVEVWRGGVSREDVVAHSQQHLSDSRVRIGASALVDARAASFGIAPEEVQEIVDSLYADYVGRLTVGKCAILVNDRTYELARAYERSAGQYGVNVIVFNALDVACQWLGVDAGLILKHLERADTVRSEEQEGAADI